MKLLFDQNLSPRLVERLASTFPESAHVETLGLGKELDKIVWTYARENGFVIVTKDVDFSELGLLSGFPPKIVWIRRGNCATREIEQMLRENTPAIESLSQDPETGILTLF
jgi:predicted nuclease of predicted toxin-antitoxin system